MISPRCFVSKHLSSSMCAEAKACVAEKALCCRPVDRASQYNLPTSSCGKKNPTRCKIPVWGSVEQMKREGVVRASASVCISLFLSWLLTPLPHYLFSLYCIRRKKYICQRLYNGGYLLKKKTYKALSANKHLVTHQLEKTKMLFFNCK